MLARCATCLAPQALAVRQGGGHDACYVHIWGAALAAAAGVAAARYHGFTARGVMLRWHTQERATYLCLLAALALAMLLYVEIVVIAGVGGGGATAEPPPQELGWLATAAAVAPLQPAARQLRPPPRHER